jgi:hypothetical protein
VELDLVSIQITLSGARNEQGSGPTPGAGRAGRVEVAPLRLTSETLYNLEDNLLLFFTGYTRPASEILKDQDTRSRANDPEITAHLHFIKQLGYDSKDALERGDLRRFAELMHVHWEHKKTAHINDEGWNGVFAAWLRSSRLRPGDLVLVFSVGGGDREKQVSANIVAALEYAKAAGAKILGIVGRDGGFTAGLADACVLVPVVNPLHVTPHSEAFQAVVWHLLVSHPDLKSARARWESLDLG